MALFTVPMDTLLNGDMSTHASTIKDDLKKRLRFEQQKSSDTREETNLWACAVDFLTHSVLAFAAWQYINCANDRKDKKESQDLKLCYVCNTLWTSDKSSSCD